MKTNLPPYVRCGPDVCPGHHLHLDDVPRDVVYGAALPLDLDDRGAEAAMALAASVAMMYGTAREGCEYEPTIGIHKGPLTDFQAREWIATAVRSKP